MRRIVVFLVVVVFILHTSFFGSTYSKSAFTIIIDKSDYELHVYDAEGWLITYPVVFGSNDLGDKMYQGDRKTPEGTFTIISKKVHNKWSRYMAIDYPTRDSYTRFEQRKQMGLIPAHAKIGGDIGIHGTWPGADFAVDKYENWTLGCISLKNEHVQQLFNTIPIGTRVTIRR